MIFAAIIVLLTFSFLITFLIFSLIKIRGDIGFELSFERYEIIILILIFSGFLGFTVFTYSKIGSYEDVLISKIIQETETNSDSYKGNEELVENMKISLKKKSDNLMYAMLLANYEKSVANYEEALRYYALALEISPDDAPILAQQAETLFLANNRQFNESVNTAIEAAYVADNGQPLVLGLMGVRSYLNEDYEDAVFFWKKALVNIDDNDPLHNSYTDGINAAQEKILNR